MLLKGDFSEETKVDHVVPEWAQYMDEGDFISYMPSFVGNKYLDKFEELKLMSEEKGEITYYLYDPTKNGFSADGKYPLIMFIHGYTNAMDGIKCVGHSGAEMFADPVRQEKMGGAYLLVPLANERRNENGEVVDSWDEGYLPGLKAIIEKTRSENPAISKVAVGGGSSGGYMTWNMINAYPEMFAGAFPVSGGNDDICKCIDTHIKILFACSRYDEFGAFDRIGEKNIKKLEAASNVITYFPKFLRNGDGGVASLYFGIEMGQHCMITQLQADFIYDDGTPYIPELPDGMTGWFRDL